MDIVQVGKAARWKETKRDVFEFRKIWVQILLEKVTYSL